MAGFFKAAALGALIAGATATGPALAQYYYPPSPPPAYYPPPPPPGYYPRPGYDGGYYRPRRVRMSRVCATDRTMCYQAPQEIGTWCKCGGGITRSTGEIVPER